MEKTGFQDQLELMQGRLRIIREPEGYYVVGEGMVLPVMSYEEGLKLIRECETERVRSLAARPSGKKEDPNP